MKNNFFVSLAGFPKFALGFAATIGFRLLTPFIGFANISPLMATELAGAKAYGPWVAGVYGALSIFLLDLLVGKVGVWTIFTTISYGLVGVAGAYFLRNREASVKNFAIFSIAGTIFFDLVTGVLMGPLVFGQSFASALIGQIPFTVRHLAGNTFFAVVLSLWFYRKVMTNPRFELARIFQFV